MIVGITYIATSITLALLLVFARRERRLDPMVFRYPKLLLRVLVCCVPIIGLLGVFAVYTTPNGRIASEKNIVIVGFCLLVGVVGFMCAYFASFSVEISIEAVTVRRMFGQTSMPFEQVKSIILVRGARSDRKLVLLDSKGHVITLWASLQDSSDLFGLIRQKTENFGIECREKKVA